MIGGHSRKDYPAEPLYTPKFGQWRDVSIWRGGDIAMEVTRAATTAAPADDGTGP